MQFVFEQIRVGGDRNFGYLIGDRSARVAALIDPSYQPQLLIDRASAQHLSVQTILNTHDHHDHTNGNEEATRTTQAELFHSYDLQDNQEIALGDLILRVLRVPGHCPDHVVYYIPRYDVLITGDHLFVGKVGGTPTMDAAKEQYSNLQRLLADLPLETTIWPGHDFGCRPSSTLALEKETNPFLCTKSLEEFLDLKAGWSQFKAEHGLL